MLMAVVRRAKFPSIDRYVEEKELALSQEEALLLVHQASESIDRMANTLDGAHETVVRILKGRTEKARRSVGPVTL